MDRVLSLLGIAQKAGKVVSGGFLCEKSIKAKQARLVILAGDAQKNTVSTISNKCTFYNIPFGFYGTKETLGHAIGKEELQMRTKKQGRRPESPDRLTARLL